MKEVILSADNKAKIYLVTNKVANNLLDYCHDFAANWIWKDPNGQKLLQCIEGMKVAVYNESHFINYLNEWIFPEEPSIFVKELDYYDYELPEEYKNYPQFNF